MTTTLSAFILSLLSFLLLSFVCCLQGPQTKSSHVFLLSYACDVSPPSCLFILIYHIKCNILMVLLYMSPFILFVNIDINYLISYPKFINHFSMRLDLEQ